MNTGLEECSCATKANANFTIEEMTSGNPNLAKYTETDSIFSEKNVRFYATEEAEEYTWYIGSEVIHTREVMRYFDNSLVGQTIPVKLVVKKSPNLICFPNEDGTDSLVKYFTVAQLPTYDFLDFVFFKVISTSSTSRPVLWSTILPLTTLVV